MVSKHSLTPHPLALSTTSHVCHPSKADPVPSSPNSSYRILLKGKVLYSINQHWAQSWSRSIGSQNTGNLSHKPGGRLSLLSARLVVTFPAKEITTLTVLQTRGGFSPFHSNRKTGEQRRGHVRPPTIEWNDATVYQNEQTSTTATKTWHGWHNWPSCRPSHVQFSLSSVKPWAHQSLSGESYAPPSSSCWLESVHHHCAPVTRQPNTWIGR